MNLQDVLKDKVTEGMTLEEVLAVASEIEIDDKAEDLAKLKNLLDKANSEASDYKKKLRNTLTEQERAEADRKQAQEELQANYNALLKKTTIAEHKANFLTLGFDEKLAGEAATALFEGDVEKLFKNIKTNNEGLVKKVKSDVLKETPRPEDGGSKTKPMDLETFRTMSSEERLKFSQENPEQYKQLYNGGNLDGRN